MTSSLIDFLDHRIIALIVCLSIALASVVAILIRFTIHNREYKRSQSAAKKENKPVPKDEKIP